MLIALPALNDNYIWCYAREDLPWIVIDPAEAEPVLKFLQQNGRTLAAILLTHNHTDHVGGVKKLAAHFPNLPIYGPAECADFANQIVQQGWFETANYQFEVIPSGGHTAGHISYLLEGHLFCGDTIFAAGCGRVFTGDYAQMFTSLQHLKALPDSTIVCPAHEYTLSNIAFADKHLTQKSALENFRVFVEKQRSQNLPSLPTNLALEREINPFLQAQNLEEFTRLRKLKDMA